MGLGNGLAPNNNRRPAITWTDAENDTWHLMASIECEVLTKKCNPNETKSFELQNNLTQREYTFIEH